MYKEKNSNRGGSVMILEQLLLRIKESKIKLWVENNRLNYLAPEKSLSAELEENLMNMEDDIINLFNELYTGVIDEENKKNQIESSKLMELPFDYNRRVYTQNNYNLKSFYINRFTSKFKVMEYTDELILLATLKILFYRYTNDNDILTGVLCSNNDKTSCFSNILISHTTISEKLSFRNILYILSDELKASAERSIMPIDSIINRILRDKNSNFHPFYQVMFSFNSFENESIEQLQTNSFSLDIEEPLVDIHISFIKLKDCIKGFIWYNASLFKPDTIDRMIVHYKTLLSSVLNNPDEKISILPILGEEEKQQLNSIGEMNNYSSDKLVSEIFEDQVEKTPNNIAMIYRNEKLTFRELNEKINQLANRLIKVGIKREIPVGVFLERSQYTIISLMAILKAGGAYVPIDLSYPSTQIRNILEQTELYVILTQKDLNDRIPSNSIKLINLDDYFSKIQKESTENPKNTANIDDLALIMYTSGSTGVPKGVAHGQRMLLNYLSWWWKNYPINSDDVLCQRTSVNFIPSLHEFLFGLLRGCPTVILPDEVVKDPFKLMDEIAKHKITRIRVVPSLLKMILDSGIELNVRVPDLKFWIIAGEPLSIELYNKFRISVKNAVFIDEFGTTETNGILIYDATNHSDDMKIIPMGKPISNIKVYLLDRNKQIVPIGVAGEIHVGSVCVAKGYLKLPEVTHERFIKNPFSNEINSRLYNTGDYARYLSDGTIQYIGRSDNQVKIRGIRVELTQIEIELSKHPGIEENAVCVIDSKFGGKKLAAFIIMKEGMIESSKDLRKYFKTRLPEYFVPSHINIIKSMPRTPNGKLDRNALPSLILENLSGNFETGNREEITIANRDDLLTEVISVIRGKTSDILEVAPERIQLNQNFIDLGIDSVSIVTLLKSLNSEFNTDMTISILYDYSCINDLSKYIISILKEKDLKKYILSIANGRSENGDNYKGHDEEVSKLINNENKQIDDNSIAIIGISGRFPGAENVTQLWHNLADGVSHITEVPNSRWSIDEYYDKDIKVINKTSSKVGGFIKDVDQFEPLFFNISVREAELMDPQQRLCLMEAWKTFEDAGYSVKELSGSNTGVFIGARQGDYFERINDKGIAPDAYTLMGNDSSILAARVSYFLNLKGPSIPIDTACSSSMVAVHIACQSILSGECGMALVGGVSIISSHDFYIKTAKAGMFSRNDRCATFDNEADGFVAGEAVTFVLLKSLKSAIKDKDNIYGVIRASGINQDGKTNGITSPSTLSQEKLEFETYKKAGINPETISYVEAHGTGTKLGDPIEIEALTAAFGRFTHKKQFCAIGSIKTNIGHTAAAAGIVGMVKVLLCFKYGKIPASLNFNNPNEHINFKQSPFYVNTQLRDWVTEGNFPKRAAVSSFGYSGTNAHIVLEEYNDGIDKSVCTYMPYYIIPISAKTERSLECMVKNLEQFIRENKGSISISNIAYTLQVGRNHFDVRYGFIVKDIDDLLYKLKTVLDGKTVEGMLFKSKKRRIEKLGQRMGNVDEIINNIKGSSTIDDFKNRITTLVEFYVEGFDIPWDVLYDDMKKLHRVSLPGYSFDTKRFWIYVPNTSHEKNSRIHPLVHNNTSTLYEQRYISHLSVNDFYISGHTIFGENVLPGAAIVEMARTSGELATDKKVFFIRNLVWLTPIIVTSSGKDIQINITSEKDTINFIVSSIVSTGKSDRDVYAKGEIGFKFENNINNYSLLDINKIIDSCENIIQGEELYSQYKSCGIDYGENFQLVKNIHVNKEEWVSHIVLDANIDLYKEKIVLNPLLIDSVLHSSGGILKSACGNNLLTYVPYIIGEIKIIDSLQNEIFAYGKLKNNGDEFKSFDILIADKSGKILAEIKELVLRPIGEMDQKEVKDHKLLLYKKTWIKSELEVGNRRKLDSVIIFDTDDEMFLRMNKQYLSILVMPGEKFKQLSNYIFTVKPGNEQDFIRLINILNSQNIAPINIIYAWSKAHIHNDLNISDSLKLSIYSLIFLSKTMLNNKINGVVRLLYMYSRRDNNPDMFDSAVAGFIKTIRRENPNFIFKSIALDDIKDVRRVMKIATDELLTENENESEISYENGDVDRRVKIIEEINMQKYKIEQLPIKKDGTYLITGGLGGVGLIFALHFAENYDANIILTGRSPMDEMNRIKLDTVREVTSKVVYIQSDVSNKEHVQELYSTINNKFGKIDGIIHTAGVIRDSFIIKKKKEEIDEVLSPKVYGTLNLYETFANEKLDFFILFSSISAVEGQIGQADYAYANSFMDEFAQSKTGIISINWSLWENGGMTIDKRYIDVLHRATGMVAMSNYEGIRMFNNALFLKEPSIVAIAKECSTCGPSQDVKNLILKEDNATMVKNFDKSISELNERAEGYFRKLISDETRIDLDEINAEDSFMDYGIDSIMILSMIDKLEKDFGELSKTLFFETQTIRELTEYFINNYQEKLSYILLNDSVYEGKELIKQNKDKYNEESKTSFYDVKQSEFKSKDSLYEKNCDKKITNQQSSCDIAIIGVSGCYPMGDNLEELWNNLKTGKDCITEIPPDRWDCNKDFMTNTDKNGVIYTKWGGFIKDVDKFDPLFFNISPKEAEKMDPQERLFLQTVWHTIEDAGYTRKELENTKVGVFTGVMWGQYHFLGVEESLKGNNISLSSSFASIANRVSYILNLHGPSLAVDTMCSSSLTAIHLAYESIQRKECEMAIVGGVNISLHRDKYLSISQGKFASSDGKCRSFGEGGDGYVPGEGVGAILLKPLDDAIVDNDNIYAVIKGTAINHGGRTNAYTVPNLKAQEQLIIDNLTRSGVKPESISYIEAHGTGTSLGDPIEIRALSKAFEKNTTRKQFCAIGSIKSNIGHLEAAAGIAGLTKVLLQMKYKQLVPSLHSKKLNTNIDFITTPFYVQQKLTKWEKLDEHCPRIAGVSAFGAGGSNAHVIVEEFEKTMTTHNENDNCTIERLFVLSAKDKERLKTYVKSIIDFIRSNSIDKAHGFNLDDMCYTLQVGREQMEERLALIFSNREELISKLTAYCKDDLKVKNLFVGNTSKKDSNQMLLFGGNLGSDFIKNIVENRELGKIAVIWVSGIDIEWNTFYYSKKLNRISIPGYPFLKERYWVPSRGESHENEVTRLETAKIHPLIDKNISDFYEQRFISKLNGNEYLFKDHIINENKCLPGSAYIEMARFASELSGRKKIRKLKNIVWKKPMIIKEETKEIYTTLHPDEKQPAFEFYTMDGETRIVHAFGNAIYGEELERYTQYRDIALIKSYCEKIMTGKECYAIFKNQGINYGPGFQNIKDIWYCDIEALAYLELSDEYKSSFKDCVLHPSIIDGAFQAAIALTKDYGSTLLLPSSIKEIDIVNPIKDKCYVHVKSCSNISPETYSYDIEILDMLGKIQISIVGFSLTAVNNYKSVGLNSKDTDLFKTIYFTKRWEILKLPEIRDESETKNNILVINGEEDIYNSLKSRFATANNKCVYLRFGTEFKVICDDLYEINPLSKKDYFMFIKLMKQQGFEPSQVIFNCINIEKTNEIKERIKNKVNPVFYLANAFIKNQLKNIYWLFVEHIENTEEDIDSFEVLSRAINSSIDGFNRSIRLEQPSYSCKNVIVYGKSNLVNIINSEINAHDYAEVMYKNNNRFVRKTFRIDSKGASIDLKDNGVYLITGGAGTLGFVFTEYLIKKKKVNVILTGRSKLSKEKIIKIHELEKTYKSSIKYIKADMSYKDDVEHLVHDIIKEYGKIDGVIHSAGVIRDSLVINKDEKEIEEVFYPKVIGTLYLDEVLKEEKLDFFILFSSIAAVLGNVGQTDYAAANRFLDYYAEYREELRQKSKRYGKTISINWPLWENSGMFVNEKTIKYMNQVSGSMPISTSEAIKAFKHCFLAGESQVIVANGEEDKITASILSMDADKVNHQAIVKTSEDYSKPMENQEEIKGKVVTFLKTILADELKLPKERINGKDTFDQYGIDSVMVMSINNVLEKYITGLSKSLLYEYYCIDELAEYFMKNHWNWANDKFCSKKIVNNTHNTMEPTKYVKEKINQSRFINTPKKILEKQIRYYSGDIAIIGISGKYPMANNLEEFWENLKDGRDCISEIPIERWEYKKYYSDDKNSNGKSCSKWGGFLKNIDKFDPLFFNISPHEAELMDPQERLFLQVAWHTVEDAGYKVTSLSKDSVGVFVGAMWGLYQLHGVEEVLKGNYVYPSSSFSSIANRVSYCLNLQGPSIALDTMCSSSITAIHLASESIRKGECNYAIAGGVNLSIHSYKYLALSDSSFLSTDGRCRAFGKGGNGYVPGEGVGAVLLKSFEKAVEDNDHIYGVIKASSINHNGKTSGYTVPSPNAQAKLILSSMEKGSIVPESISYIEAHGPGTSLGDPIEITGLINSINKNRTIEYSCPIGSVKSNIGHLESAAGIAGITKVLLQMKNKCLVPSLHSEDLNPNINFDDIPFYVQRKNEYWKRPVLSFEGVEKEYPRRASVSSFGAGGSNAHIIIEEYDNQDFDEKMEDTNYQKLIVLSAKNEEQLKVYARDVMLFVMRNMDDLEEHETSLPHLCIDNIAYTLQVGREEMEERLAVVVSGKNDLINKMKCYCDGESDIQHLYRGNAKRDKGKYDFLLEGDEGAEYISKLLDNKNLSKLAQLWVDGLSINWSLMYRLSVPHRISLPKYPFAMERCWLNMESVLEVAQNSEETQVLNGDLNSNREIKEMILHKVASLIKLNYDDITIDLELGEIGFSSIFALRMLNQINEQYGVKITLGDLKFTPILTVGEIINTIEECINDKGKLEQASFVEPSLGISDETALKHEELFPPIIDLSSSLETKNILLTGATGVLGGRILKEILEVTNSNIYCLVRAKTMQQAKERVQAMLKIYDPEQKLAGQFKQRVIPVIGDITSDALGIEDELYNQLTKKIHMVIHSAAKLSLAGLYDEVKYSNVDGTTNMIEFALKTEQKYFIFISSHGVMGDRWLQACKPFTEKDICLGQGFKDMGYQKSKYDAELIVRQAINRGLNWTIVRAGNIMGDSVSGYYPFGVTSVTGIYYDLFKTAISTKVAPDTPLYFDITPVDYVSKSIVYLCTIRKTVFETYHVTNPCYIKAPDVYALVKDYGYDIDIIDNEKYLRTIKMQSDNLGKDTSVILEIMRFNPIYSGNIKGSSYADNSYTTNILEKAGIVCHKVDYELIKIYIEYCIKTGYLKEPNTKNNI